MVNYRGRREAKVIALSLFCMILLAQHPLFAAKVVAFVPMQGDWQAAGAEMRNGYAVAQQRLRETSGSSLNLEILDCSIEPQALHTIVLGLADSDCIGIIGGYPSKAATVISEAASIIGMPYLIDCASADTLTKTGLDCVFRLFPPQSYVNDGVLAWASEVGGKGRLAVVLGDTMSFRQSVDELEDALKSRWGGAVERIGFKRGQQDFTEILAGLEKKNPAIVWLLGTTSENGELLRQARTRDWTPYAFVIGSPEMANRRLISYSSGAAEFALGPAIWLPKLPQIPVQDFVRSYHKLTGEEPSVRDAYSYVGLLVLADAIKRAESEKRDKIRVALTETDASTIVGRVKFERFRGFVQQNRPTTYAVQVVNDSWEIVYPLDLVTADDVYPVPGWDERAKPIAVDTRPKLKLFILGVTGLLAGALVVREALSRRNID